MSAEDARSVVLARLAAALGRPTPDVDPAAVSAGVTRRYRRAGDAPRPADLVGLFAERVADYGATVTRVPESGVADAVAAAAGTGAVLAAPGLDPAWLAGLPGAAVDDPPRTPLELAGVDAVVTAAAVAVAETGTVVLDHRGDQGRRVLTLVPDHHVCVVLASQVVADVPDAIAALDPARPLTWVSGPSATSDIELDRVVGVHGPRRLDVIIAGG